ncbi:hypothetical protein P2G74_01360 [Cronobacter muytjensii]|uniref:hypothetical protein n=1 Tax=Cronobacter muytjensii TaxID=413501 RepID=UPI002DB877EE|nr:hypothetical protein [Cronobacter muytjensii]MEB8638621.1 hypothetical protein [Cronobacter muytjensii]
MSNLRLAYSRTNQPSTTNDPQSSWGSGGGDGGGSDMEQRIKELEKDLGNMKTAVEVMKVTLSTKEDISALRVDIAGIKADIADAKTDIHSALRTQLIATFGFILTIVGIATTIAVKILSH